MSIIQNSIDIIRLNKISTPIISIILKDTKDNINLIISDNAGGIQISPIEDIFKPFNSKKEKSSTGIGLYMSKMIIKDQFKGKISAKNTEDGAEFLISLPH